MASLWAGWDLLTRAAVRRLVCSLNAFTFQWELTLVQVSNWFSSEAVRAAKVLEENRSVTGASTSSGVLYYVLPEGPTDCGSNDISKGHLLL